MDYSKHELGTTNMLYSPRKFASPQRPLSSVPKVAVLERFHCINGNDKKFKRCLSLGSPAMRRPISGLFFNFPREDDPHAVSTAGNRLEYNRP